MIIGCGKDIIKSASLKLHKCSSFKRTSLEEVAKRVASFLRFYGYKVEINKDTFDISWKDA